MPHICLKTVSIYDIYRNYSEAVKNNNQIAMNQFSKKIFIIATVVFGLLLIPSFLAALGEDEGTLPDNSIWVIFTRLFNILRFPTHTLFWRIITRGGATIYFVGLFINCMFYGLLTERIIVLLGKGVKKLTKMTD